MKKIQWETKYRNRNKCATDYNHHISHKLKRQQEPYVEHGRSKLRPTNQKNQQNSRMENTYWSGHERYSQSTNKILFFKTQIQLWWRNRCLCCEVCCQASLHFSAPAIHTVFSKHEKLPSLTMFVNASVTSRTEEVKIVSEKAREKTGHRMNKVRVFFLYKIHV